MQVHPFFYRLLSIFSTSIRAHQLKQKDGPTRAFLRPFTCIIVSYLCKMDCFATKLQDNGVVCSFDEQSDSGGDQFYSTVGARMFSTSLHVPALFLATRSKMKDPRPIIVTTLTDNCPTTEDGLTVTQLNPKPLQPMPNRRTSTSIVVPTSQQPFVVAASCLLFPTLNRRTSMSTVVPTRHRLFVSPATLCAAYVYQDAYCKILTPQYVRIHMSLKFFPHFSHPLYGIEVTLVRLQYLHMSASRECN